MLPESLLAQLKDLLATQMGVDFRGNGWADFEHRIALAAKDSGVKDVRDYISQLFSTPLPRSQIEILARHLTVGETYFFREKQSFDALASHVLPELLRKRELTQRRLRIWSAGCCTGEEAYSIAILLDRLLPHQENWDIRIVGTDINSDFLQKARQAVYGEWSFRGTPEWVRNEYFKKKRNGMFELLPKISERVQFAYLNLADDNYPSPYTHNDHLDVIFCRNVLMYFSHEQAGRVVGRFRRALNDGGLLLVSPAETSATLFKGFSLVNYPGAMFYRVGIPRMQHQAVPSRPNLPQPGRKTVTSSSKPHRAAKPAIIQHGTTSAEDAGELARKARRCADEGQLGDAAQWCAKAIAAEKMNPAHHYLLATIEQERGMIPAAIEALQRTLYLDQDFVLAHFALANLRFLEGRFNDTRRHLKTVHCLLKHHPADEPLPESDGLTFGRLSEIAASLNASLNESQPMTRVY
jgi:chemotaxis protein methyltransferase CheR